MIRWIKRLRGQEDWVSRALRLGLEAYDREMSGKGQNLESPRNIQVRREPRRVSIESMPSIP